MTPTRMTMPTRTPITIQSVPPEADAEPPGRAGSQVDPVQRHRRSSDIAGLHCAPSHHQKPSAEKRVCNEVGAAGPGFPPTAGSIEINAAVVFRAERPRIFAA